MLPKLTLIVVTDKQFFVAAVKVPIAVLGAQRDNGLPPAQMKRFDEILSAKPKVRDLTSSYFGPLLSHQSLKYSAMQN